MTHYILTVDGEFAGRLTTWEAKRWEMDHHEPPAPEDELVGGWPDGVCLAEPTCDRTLLN